MAKKDNNNGQKQGFFTRHRNIRNIAIIAGIPLILGYAGFVGYTISHQQLGSKAQSSEFYQEQAESIREKYSDLLHDNVELSNSLVRQDRLHQQELVEYSDLLHDNVELSNSLVRQDRLHQQELVDLAEETAKEAAEEMAELQEKATFGTYLLEDLVDDWKGNVANLKESNQLHSVFPPFFNKIDRGAAETGKLTIMVYDIGSSGTTAYNPDEIEEFMNRAFSSLGIDINVKYQQINPLESLLLRAANKGEIASSQKALDIANEFSSFIENNEMGDVLKSNSDQIPLIHGVGETAFALARYLELIIGKENIAKFSDIPGTEEYDTNAVNIIAVLADFKDNGAESAVYNNPLNGTAGYILLDKGEEPYFNPEMEFIDHVRYTDIRAIAEFLTHEVGHILGLDHKEFPLDIMSYSTIGNSIISEYPELAFGGGSQIEWEDTLNKYNNPEKLDIGDFELSIPAQTICGGESTYVTASLTDGEDFYTVEFGIRNRSTKVGDIKVEGISADRDGHTLFEDLDSSVYDVVADLYKNGEFVKSNQSTFTVEDCRGRLQEFAKYDSPKSNIADLVVEELEDGGIEFYSRLNDDNGTDAFVIVTNNEGEVVLSENFYGSGRNDHLGKRFKLPSVPDTYRISVNYEQWSSNSTAVVTKTVVVSLN